MDSLQYVLTLLADLTDDEKMTASLVEAADGLVPLTIIQSLFFYVFLFILSYLLYTVVCSCFTPYNATWYV